MPFTVRKATPGDVEDALGLVAAMFRDLGTSDIPESWYDDARKALASRVGEDAQTFVTVDGPHVIAVAVGLIDQRLPSPRRPDGRMGYVEWLATDESARRRGAARLALEALLRWFHDKGVRAVDVHASVAATPLYESLGFATPKGSALRKVV